MKEIEVANKPLGMVRKILTNKSQGTIAQSVRFELEEKSTNLVVC